MMDVEQLNISEVVMALLKEFSAMTDYPTLRDAFPHRLASLLNCHCVLLYLHIDDSLQFSSGSFYNTPGWSTALLAVAHINPISQHSDLPEARAWREQRAILTPADHPTNVAIPLIYRQHTIGILVLTRCATAHSAPPPWQLSEMKGLEAIAGVLALLLENTRLFEQSRERIHELSLLNSISSQMNCSIYELQRLRSIVIQRTREIAAVDLCELLLPATQYDALPWLTPQLSTSLFHHFQAQSAPVPFTIERPMASDMIYARDFLAQLPAIIKTFFALPLLGGRTVTIPGKALSQSNVGTSRDQEPKVLGLIIGGYYQPLQLRHSVLTLLQVFASQTSAVIENMHLMEEVIAARNEARQLLRQVLDDQHLKELILESIPSGLITTDPQGKISTFNRAAGAILGYRAYEVLGQPLHKFLDLRATFSSLPQSSFTTTPNSSATDKTQSHTILTMDRFDHELVLDVDVRLLYNDLGESLGIQATFTDMTSLHHLEQEKRRLDRLASLGEMAANVAHEVRNPLASIKTSIEMLRDDLLPPDSAPSPVPLSSQTDWAHESISVVLKEVERLDTLVRDLLLFARPRQRHCMRCNLVALSKHVLKLIAPQCQLAGILVQQIYDVVPPIWGDMGQLEQVLLNLFMNALQAMPDGGVLTISCRCFPGENTLADLSNHPVERPQFSTRMFPESALEQQQWIEFLVSDTGIGVALDQLERIFQPFYTTKAHGIGLGLAITRRLIEDHGGSILVESRLGYGATVSVRLPPALNEEDNQYGERTEA